MTLGFTSIGSQPIASLPGVAAHGVIQIKANVFLREGAAHGVISLHGFANWDFRIFAASSDFITAPDDTLASRNFPGTLNQPLEFTRSILGSSRIGEMQVGFGEMILDNTEGDYDFLIRGYSIDGRRIVVRLGDGRQSYDTFGVVFDGTATGWHVEEAEFRVAIRDYGYRLEVPVSPNTYKGTGDVEGTSDLKGKRRPRAFGTVQNVSPPMVVPNKNAYQVNDGPIEAVDNVYVRGAALNQGVDHPTVSSLLAATVAGGSYDTCLSAGWFRVAFTTTEDMGRITADVRGDKAAGVYAATTAQIVRRLLSVAGLEDEDVNSESFAEVDALQPSPVGIWFDLDDEVEVNQAIDQMTLGVGGWGGFRRNGQFEIGIFTAPANPPVIAFDRIEIVDIERMQAPDFMSPPPWRQRVVYARNWTVQDDPAGSVTQNQPERAAYLKEDWRLAVASDDRVKADHLMAQDPSPIESYFASEDAAYKEALRLLNLFKRPRSLYRLVLKTQPFLLEVGDVVGVTYPRWDLTEGKLLRIVELREDGRNNQVEIVGFG